MTIVSKTPLRFSFFSGGSDMKSFYSREQGAALSVTIDKYIYVVLHHTDAVPGIKMRFPHMSQDAGSLEEVNHVLTRECLKAYGVDDCATVASMSDVPSFGTGLGSSSAYAVGLLNCLSLSADRPYSVYWRTKLAEEACEVEIERCGFPIGKQDSYAASFGGLNLFRFNPDESVEIDKLYVPERTLTDLQDSLVLLYTGRGRSSHDILRGQSAATSDAKKMRLLRDNRDRVFSAKQLLVGGHVEAFGAVLHEAWVAKREVVRGISDEQIDSIYETATQHGAVGGKVLGAGGGGFMLFSVNPERRAEMIRAVQLRHPETSVHPFRFVFRGTEVVAEC